MNTYITIGAIALSILILGAAYVGLPEKSGEELASTEVSSVLSVTNDGHDFGEIDIFGGKVQTTYTLTNEGPDDVTITGAQTSCMCTEGEIAGRTFGMHGSNVEAVTIPAGGSETVTATFDPLAHGPNGTGKITRELMLTTNSTAMPTLRLRFSGDVIKNESN